ncbi:MULTISPECIES: tyrosine-type recombinase/integrase [Bacillus cereus group]|uniref:Tyr recombinase domain-containing protein n=1 Tax=Bacillus wiedmannii TaxID=1890302 RepID=A0A1C4FCN5_9BACI|nr:MULTISPECIES: tyrosine-type recombinase/integrase [Bacillus cereus group]KAA0776189.1 site-specific integrase [Bacillus sp. AR2-1]SCC53604.1 Uncharacterized protein BC05F1_04264 [Bacillus wiedmannii]
MKFVQPIRDKKKLEEVKEVLRRQSYRDLFLFEMGINTALREKINEYVNGMKETDCLFASKKTGKPITRIQAYRIMNAAAEKVELDEIGTHTLRKTFGYHYYQKTKDVVMLQTIFNHSAPSITLRYIGIQQDEIDKSLEDFSL